ncbi:MAG TPA: YdjY domain-containing protein [Planctomycetota bacterium]|nr:YdjY domain-containing protein [Planctomycetota bacterium]
MTRTQGLILAPIILFSGACDDSEPSLPSASAAGAATGRGGLLFMNPAARELRFSAVFHRANAEEGTWHFLVEKNRTMASRAIFTTDVTPAQFYKSFQEIGASDGNNVTPANSREEKIATRGDAVDFTFEWKGSDGAIPLEKLVTEAVPDIPSSGGVRGLELRFGGNMTAEDASSPPAHVSGCLACLYTCSAGVVSNSKANEALLKREKGVSRYRIQPATDIPDGARVTIVTRIKE